MSTITITIREYLEDNRTIILGYGILSLLFYLVNYAFFRGSLDAPIDIIFIMGYIVFIPGVVVFITMLRSDIEFVNENNDYFMTLLIHILIPLIMSFLFAVVYDSIRVSNSSYWLDFLRLHASSLPLIFASIIIVIEWKFRLRYLPMKVIIIVLYIASYMVIHYLVYRGTTTNIANLLTILYTIIIPGLLIGVWYRYKVIETY